MTRLVLAFLLVSVASSARAQSAASAQAAAPPSPPGLVLVFDGGGAHVSGDRVRRALATGLHRPILRLTDDGATATTGRLTVAFSPPDRWVIDFVRGEVHTTRTVVLRSSTVATLSRVAIAIVADAEPTPAPAHASASARRGEWIALIGDEILDPFTGGPATTHRRSLAMIQELVDPFGGSPATRRTYDDVIDPWSH